MVFFGRFSHFYEKNAFQKKTLTERNNKYTLKALFQL